MKMNKMSQKTLLKLIKESIEDDKKALEDVLNPLLADEFIAWEQYKMMDLAARGKCLDKVQKVFGENGEDELDDHYENLYKWMQSAGLACENLPKKYHEIANCKFVDISRFDETGKLIDIAIDAEKAAIKAYEEVLKKDVVKTYPDLVVTLSGFLKDEREHLKELLDVRGMMKHDGDKEKQNESKMVTITADKPVLPTRKVIKRRLR